MSWIQTFTGKKVEFGMKYEPDVICLEDIAHSLARLCRYGGHVKTAHFSVAQHSEIVALCAQAMVLDGFKPKNGCSQIDFILWGLLHDAAEAYIGDIISPIKRLLPELKYYEDALMTNICTEFDIDHRMPAEIKVLDRWAMQQERAHFLGPSPEQWSDPVVNSSLPFAPDKLLKRGIPPVEMEQRFKMLYHAIKVQGVGFEWQI